MEGHIFSMLLDCIREIGLKDSTQLKNISARHQFGFVSTPSLWSIGMKLHYKILAMALASLSGLQRKLNFEDLPHMPCYHSGCSL